MFWRLKKEWAALEIDLGNLVTLDIINLDKELQDVAHLALAWDLEKLERKVLTQNSNSCHSSFILRIQH